MFLFHPVFPFRHSLMTVFPYLWCRFFLLVFSGTAIVGLDEVGALGPEEMQGPLEVRRAGF